MADTSGSGKWEKYNLTQTKAKERRAKVKKYMPQQAELTFGENAPF